MNVDLHLHTTASDGKLSPEEIVALALSKKLSIIAITDHDTVDGIAPALAAAQNSSLIVIPGVEINTDAADDELHILGYFIDYTCHELTSRLQDLCNSRHTRALRMVEKLNSLGIEMDWQQVLEVAQGSSIGRPHIAQVLLQRGYISSIREAFVKYIGRNCPAYVEREKITPVEAVKLIVCAAGLPVLAHPGTVSNLTRLIPELKSAGMVGIEACYNGYSVGTVTRLVTLAREYGLIYTGGSDYHGLDTGETPLGGAKVPSEAVSNLFALAGRSLPRL